MTFIVGSVLSFFSLLKESIQMLSDGLSFVKRQKTYEMDEIIQEIEVGNLNYGDTISLTGVFSEFVPIDRNIFFPAPGASAFLDSLPCRPFQINGYYCGFMQHFGSTLAGSPDGLPVFYRDATPRPVFSSYSGLSMEIKGRLTSLPVAWKRLLDTKTPFGIKVDKIELIGAETEGFGAILWAVGKRKNPSTSSSDGSIRISEDYWSFNSRLANSEDYFFLGGGTQKTRHGSTRERFDTIFDFYGVNLLDEQSYSRVADSLKKQTHDYVIEGQFDMNLLPPDRIKYIKKQIGLI